LVSAMIVLLKKMFKLNLIISVFYFVIMFNAVEKNGNEIHGKKLFQLVIVNTFSSMYKNAYIPLV